MQRNLRFSPLVGALAPATSAPGLGPPHATSAAGLGSPLPTSAPGTGSLQYTVRADPCWEPTQFGPPPLSPGADEACDVVLLLQVDASSPDIDTVDRAIRRYFP